MADEWMSTADHAAPSPPANGGWMSTADHAVSPASRSQVAVTAAQGLLHEFAGGVGDVIKGLWDAAINPSQEITGHLQKGEYGQALKGVIEQTIPGYTVVVKPQLKQAQQAYNYARAGRPSEAVGHGVAALTPVVGPIAADIAETGAGEPEMPPGQQVGPARIPQPVRAAGQAATMAVLPQVTEGIPEAANWAIERGGPPLKAAVKAGGPDVAIGAGKMIAGGAAGEFLPDLPPYARNLGGLVYGGPQVLRGLGKGARAAWLEAQAQAAARRLQERIAAQPEFTPEYAPAGRATEPAAPPTPEAVAQAARDAHEAAFRDQVTQSLTGGSVAKFGDLDNPKAIAAIDSLARQEMARYDRLTQPQPAAPAPPQAAPQPPPAAPQAAQQAPYVPSMPEGTTLQDLLRQDLEAKRAAAQAAAPPETPAAAPETAAGAPEAAEATPQPKTVEELSNALNEALAEEPAKPKTVEEYKAQARAKRAAATPQWADYLQSKGITADDVAKWSHREKWRFQAQAEDAPEGLTVPTGKGAAAILEELRKREAAAKAQPAAPAEEPRPMTPGGMALQPFTVARELAARGVNSTKAADFSGERWRALGVMPNQVAPVIRALQAQERLGMTAVQ